MPLDSKFQNPWLGPRSVGGVFVPASQNVPPCEKVNMAGKVPSTAPVLQLSRVTTVFHEPSSFLYSSRGSCADTDI